MSALPRARDHLAKASPPKARFAMIYLTFLQRAYDQVVHDGIQRLPVRFAMDRRLVGVTPGQCRGFVNAPSVPATTSC
jgi:hypothetical protein